MIKNARYPRQSSQELTAGAGQFSLKETICYRVGELATKTSNDTSKKKSSLGKLRRTGSGIKRIRSGNATAMSTKTTTIKI